MRLKIFKKLRTASLNSEFTGSYKKERYLKRFLVVQNLKIAESSVFIFSKLFRLTLIGRKRQYEGKHVSSGYL